MEINTINLVGRAGREPDVRYFESGSVVANFTLAVNRRSRDEEPDWFNLEIWGKQAQIAADKAGQKALSLGLTSIEVEVSGPGSGRESAVRALNGCGLKVTKISDVTPIPHNGCRPPKKRRV